jgi:2-phospho-L-lactate/phosphoenolpyruvate guanylyltransferase
VPGAQPASPSWLGPAALLVPVKAFNQAKLRLAGALSPGERAELARTLATGVVAAAGDLAVAVVCDDREVAHWARDLGALVIWEPGRGLNGAVQEGVDRLTAAGVEHVVIAHADLPLASDLGWIARFPGVTLIPDRHHEGTNVIGIPARSSFTFGYGPGSFARHLAEARRLGLPVRTVHGSPLAWDVDVPADLLPVIG